MRIRQTRWPVGVLVALMLVGTVSATPATAFGTITLGKQSAEHEHITRAALACPGDAPSDGTCFESETLDQLAGSTATLGAVGAPDILYPLVGAQHCDGGDYLDKDHYDGKVYPQSEAAAAAAIMACEQRADENLNAASSRAKKMLDDEGHVTTFQTSLTCQFLAPGGRGKCNSLEAFGKTLHATQDFYSHSNYADTNGPGPIGRLNPPGLGLSGSSREMNLQAGRYRRPGLITGCFSTPDTFDGTFSCDKHVTHKTLNKDEGTITDKGAASKGVTARGKTPGNFENAVAGAIADTKTQWSDLRQRITDEYKDQAPLIICALTRDDPVKDCTGRKLAIVVDSSGSNQITDPSGLRIAAAQQFNETLRTKESTKGTDEFPDRSAVIDFDESARVISPLDDPSTASFAGIDADGGTLIASGVSAGIAELTKDTPDQTKDRSGIVVLTDGEDSDVQGLINEINRAESLGIRVNVGFLAPSNPVPFAKGAAPVEPSAFAAKDRFVAAAAPTTVTEAILATGGFFATIDSAQAQKDFVDVVTRRGATAIDDTNGDDDGAQLQPGLEVTGLAGTGSDDHFSYPGEAGRAVKITVSSPGEPVTAVLTDLHAAQQVATGTTDPTTPVILTYTPTADGPLELRVRADTGSPIYSVKLEVDQTPTKGFVHVVQAIPGATADVRIQGQKLITGLEYGLEPTVLAIKPGKVHVSARIRGAGLKVRLRGRFTATAGSVITVSTELDAGGKPTLRITTS
jgi:hypothetical protein